jgi:phosphatidylglycerophosphate synthase
MEKKIHWVATSLIIFIQFVLAIYNFMYATKGNFYTGNVGATGIMTWLFIFFIIFLILLNLIISLARKKISIGVAIKMLAISLFAVIIIAYVDNYILIYKGV